MSLPEAVHKLTQTVDQGDRTVTIHPAAVETPRGVLLVDVGYPGELDQVETGLDAAGLSLDDVTAVLLTHQDGDHAGGLSDLLDRTDATVYAHQNCAPYVDGREHPIKSPEGHRYPPADVDVQLVGGERFRTDAGLMDVVYTPGHAPGHLSLYFPPERLLLAADALTADESGLAGPSEQFTLEMDEALDSAASLAKRDVEQVLCFHGGLVAADGDRIAAVVDEVG